MYFPQ